MGTYMIGCDLSHHNEDIPLGMQFYFFKSTEGVTYNDPKCQELLGTCWNPDVATVNGFYHFAQPINNDYKSEAIHFLDAIQLHTGKCLMALDWEGNAERTSIKWAQEWLKYVHSETGCRPFLYASASYLEMKHDEAFLNDFPIWVAHYGQKSRYKRFKKRGNIWQFTSSPCDLDLFYGTKKELMSYAIKP